MPEVSKWNWKRPELSAVTEQLCTMVVEQEDRAKSLKELIRNAVENPTPYLPASPMSADEKAAWQWGFAEGMNVVLEYIKSGQPAPR